MDKLTDELASAIETLIEAVKKSQCLSLMTANEAQSMKLALMRGHEALNQFYGVESEKPETWKTLAKEAKKKNGFGLVHAAQVCRQETGLSMEEALEEVKQI